MLSAESPKNVSMFTRSQIINVFKRKSFRKDFLSQAPQTEVRAMNHHFIKRIKSYEKK
tara:strand:- start:34 stop:207 length:174 start_codon:yes stop_codon:yes gene_type:complete